MQKEGIDNLKKMLQVHLVQVHQEIEKSQDVLDLYFVWLEHNTKQRLLNQILKELFDETKKKKPDL